MTVVSLNVRATAHLRTNPSYKMKGISIRKEEYQTIRILLLTLIDYQACKSNKHIPHKDIFLNISLARYLQQVYFSFFLKAP